MQTTTNPLFILFAILGYVASVLGLTVDKTWRMNAVNRRGMSNMRSSSDLANDTSVHDYSALDQKSVVGRLVPMIIVALIAVLLVITCLVFCCMVAELWPAEREEDVEAGPQETTPLRAHGSLVDGESHRPFRDVYNGGAAPAFAGSFGGRFYSGGGCGGGFSSGFGF